jgi:N-alpha-acetyltransferase 35, NatC auxiliary subunit
MDPKMDSGFLAPGETLYDDYDVLQDLLPEEVIAIMDQLLCFEVRHQTKDRMSC